MCVCVCVRVKRERPKREFDHSSRVVVFSASRLTSLCLFLCGEKSGNVCDCVCVCVCVWLWLCVCLCVCVYLSLAPEREESTAERTVITVTLRGCDLERP